MGTFAGGAVTHAPVTREIQNFGNGAFQLGQLCNLVLYGDWIGITCNELQ